MAGILIDRFITSFPEAFLRHLAARQKAIYMQSIEAAFRNERWEAPEALSVLPSIRRALFEAEFRIAAQQCGLECVDVLHAGENASCVVVKSGNLVVTAHYVNGPHEFVRDAESRKQNAAMNDWAWGDVDEGLLLHPLPKAGNRPIYFNLLHGGFIGGQRSGHPRIDESSLFLHVAIPEAGGARRYLDNRSASEILAAYAIAPQADTFPTRTMEDRAKPRKRAIVRTAKAGE